MIRAATNPFVDALLFNQQQPFFINLVNLRATFKSPLTLTTNILIKLIHGLASAPVLKSLHLQYLTISLYLMELIHANAPLRECRVNLDPSITMLNRYSLRDTTTGDLITAQQLNNLKSLNISFEILPREVHIDLNTKIDVLNKWIIYVGKKYTNLESLKMMYEVNYDEHIDFDSVQQSIQPHISHSIGGLNRLKSYQVKKFPVTEELFTIWQQNNVKLNSLSLYVNEGNISGTFNSFTSSVSHQQRLKSFHIVAREYEIPSSEFKLGEPKQIAFNLGLYPSLVEFSLDGCLPEIIGPAQ
jgi:hypothetical protein